MLSNLWKDTNKPASPEKADEENIYLYIRIQNSEIQGLHRIHIIQ
jgi:hypothetical protein